MEWLVIPDLMDSSVLYWIDGVMGEFHLQQQWFLYPVLLFKTQVRMLRARHCTRLHETDAGRD